MPANDPAALVEWIREQHRGWNPNNPCSACQFCGESWPCRTTQAADVIEALLAERDSLLDANAQDRARIEAHADQPVKLHAAEQEIERLREQLAAADALADAVQWLSPDPVPYPELNQSALRVVDAYLAYRVARKEVRDG